MIQGIKTTLDLSRFPPPDVIEALDFEGIYDSLVTSFITWWNAKRALDPSLPEFNAQNLESEPIAAIFQAWAERELLIRQRVNDASRSNMLPFALGGDLDQIGGRFGVGRMTVIPETDTEPAVMETDERYRQRINLGIYAYNSAGSIESYQFHALTADPTIKDVAVDNPHNNRIDVTVLSSLGDGTAQLEQLNAVMAALSPTGARPLTDDARVRGAAIVTQSVAFRIVLPSGPAPEPIRRLAEQRVAAYCAERHKIGRALRVDGIIGAARSAGDIEQVIVEAPTVDVEPGIAGAVFVTSVTATAEILS